MIGKQYIAKVLQRDDRDLLYEAKRIMQDQINRTNQFLQGEPCTNGTGLYDDMNVIFDDDIEMAEIVVAALAVVSDEEALHRMQEALRRYREGKQ